MEFLAFNKHFLDGIEGCSWTSVQTAVEDAAHFLYELKYSVENSVIGSIDFAFACPRIFFSIFVFNFN